MGYKSTRARRREGLQAKDALAGEVLAALRLERLHRESP